MEPMVFGPRSRGPANHTFQVPLISAGEAARAMLASPVSSKLNFIFVSPSRHRTPSVRTHSYWALLFLVLVPGRAGVGELGQTGDVFGAAAHEDVEKLLEPRDVRRIAQDDVYFAAFVERWRG